MKCLNLLRSLVAAAALITPNLPSLNAATVDGFGDIENWTGTGSNESALIIQWNFTDGVTTTSVSYAWGYRWDDSGGSTPTGWDLLTSISAADPWLEIIPMDDYAGYESLTAAAFGIFYSPDGLASLASPGAPGIPFYLPGGPVDDTAGSTSGPNGLYQSGWASAGYWSYNYAVTPSETYPGTDASGWTYSPTGAGGRDLTDNSWDVWSFDVEFVFPEPSFVTPLAAVPEPRAVGLLGCAVFVTSLLRKRSRA